MRNCLFMIFLFHYRKVESTWIFNYCKLLNSKAIKIANTIFKIIFYVCLSVSFIVLVYGRIQENVVPCFIDEK